ncbi:hypothetical protein D9M68_752470 [compost metagenome]
MAAAQRFRIADAEDAGRAGLEIELARKLLGLLPFGDIRQDFPLDETADRIPHQLMGLGEVFLIGGHGKAPGEIERTYRALAWFSRRELRHPPGRIGLEGAYGAPYGSPRQVVAT